MNKRFVLFFSVLLVLSSTLTLHAAEEMPEISISKSTNPTDLGGRLNQKTVYTFLKFKYKNNYFSVNVPESIYGKLTEKKEKLLVDSLIELYGRAFEVFFDLFGYFPEGYRFNVTFGKTRRGGPHNRIYLYDKVSNIFPDFLPSFIGDVVFTRDQRMILSHEIGHSLFGIVIGSLQDPRTKAIEEGFVDYFPGKMFPGSTVRDTEGYKFRISPDQDENIRGLAQVDIDVSIWGETPIMKETKEKGYLGLTHHLFGLEFINAFIEVFGKEDLAEFLLRLKKTEGMPYGYDDFGTGKIRIIFTVMGYKSDQILEFEKSLHRRLKENVFEVIEEANIQEK